MFSQTIVCILDEQHFTTFGERETEKVLNKFQGNASDTLS